MRSFISGRLVATDTEATGTNVWSGDRPFAFSFANRSGNTAYWEFPVSKRRVVDYSATPRVFVDGKRVKGYTFADLEAWAADETITKVMHNSPFDCRMYEAAGCPILGKKEDTEMGMRIADSSRLSYELKPLCKQLFGIEDEDKKLLVAAANSLRLRAGKQGYKIATKESHGAEGKKHADYWLMRYAEEILVTHVKTTKGYQNGGESARRKLVEAAIAKAKGFRSLCRRYAVTDAERTITLWLFVKQLLKEHDVEHIYREEMRELWPVTYAMQSRGVFCHRETVKEGAAVATIQFDKATAEIKKLCRKAKTPLTDKFPNSSPQKIAYFIGELGLEPLRETKAGNPQIDRTFLEFYEDDVPLCRALMDEERASKALGTYFNNYLSKMTDEQIIHGNPQQNGAKTGRFAFRDPNLQNVPKRGKCRRCRADLKIVEWVGNRVRCGKCNKLTDLDIMLLVRRPFRPRPGMVWYGYDFQQIEARIFADEAEEDFMIEAFREGRDVYQDFADVITKEIGIEIGRQSTKSIFLGKLYGLGVAKLIKAIMDATGGKIDEDEAGNVVTCFDDAFPRVSGFMKDTIRSARADGYVTNRYGQRIEVWREDAYKGVNYIIQSSAARLMKRAMVRCHEYLESIGFGWLVLTIHDELIFEFSKDNRPLKVLRQLKNIMEDNGGLFPHVATTVDVTKVVKDWLTPVECTAI